MQYDQGMTHTHNGNGARSAHTATTTDTEFRAWLAGSIGLREVPSPDSSAADRLAGCLAGDLPADFDPVQAVREVRRRCE